MKLPPAEKSEIGGLHSPFPHVSISHARLLHSFPSGMIEKWDSQAGFPTMTGWAACPTQGIRPIWNILGDKVSLALRENRAALENFG
jgi:hypothetical protein